MKHIRELKDKWQIRFYDRRRSPKEVSLSVDKDSFTKRDIQRYRDDLRYRWQRGEWDPWTARLPNEDALTLFGAAEAYCKHKRTLGKRRQKGGWNAKTYTNYRANLLAFAEKVGEEKLVGRLRTDDLEAFIFRDDLAEATQAMYHRQLQTFTRWLRAEGHADVKMPTAQVTRRIIPTYLTEREMEVVCRVHNILCRERAAKKHAPQEGATTPLRKLWMTDAFRVAFYQGLRLSEIVALRVGAVDLAGKRMHVGDKTFVPKGKDEQIITITPPARDTLAHYTVGRTASDLIFSYRSGYRISKAFKAALVRAIADGVISGDKAEAHFHDLRASCCVYWLEQGVPLLDVKDLLRHKSVQTTEKYYRATIVDSQTKRFESAYQED